MGNDPNVLIQFLENVTGVHWLILGFALLVAEIASGTSYILWPAVAALFVGLVKLVVPIDWEMQ